MKVIKNNINSVQSFREYKVVKSNDLIQKSRFQLSSQEQKIILYLISKIKPDDTIFKNYTFQITDFCDICGLDRSNGANYIYIKQTLKNLRDKSIWVELENGSETTFAWIDKITINKNSGVVIIKIDDDLKPYLLQLQKCFTQYELYYILSMKSQYSIRLYELLKSYENQYGKLFDICELKKLISAENYERFPDFKRKVLDISMREINELSDMTVDYSIITEGRRYAKIQFSVKLKKSFTLKEKKADT